MILIDANLLLYAYNERSRDHVLAQRWIAIALSAEANVGIPVQCVLAFLRLSTHPKIAGPDTSLETAVAAVDSWFSRSNVRLVSPGPLHWSIFRRFCLDAGVVGDLTTDAHIAALTVEHDGTLYTTDRDFARFPGLRWHNPLATA